MLLIACLPVSLVLGRNWYQLLADFQTVLPWHPAWKELSLEQKEWHRQLKSTRYSIYELPCTVWIHGQPSDCAHDVFSVLCGPPHLAPECSSRGGQEGSCFGREHFLLFLSGTVWYAALLCSDNARLVAQMKARFVYANSTEETKVHEKLLPLLQLLNHTPCPACSESNPHTLT